MAPMALRLLYKSTYITQIVLSYVIIVFQHLVVTLCYLFTNTLKFDLLQQSDYTSDSPAVVWWFMSAWISGDLWQVVLWINTLTQLGAGLV